MGKTWLVFESEEWFEIRNQHFDSWFMENAEAIKLANILSHIGEIWDDLRDGDKPASAEEALGLIFGQLFTNSFWTENYAALYPTVVLGLNSWIDANALEDSENPNLRLLSFHLRGWYVEFVQLLAFLCGGWNHLRKVSPGMREFYFGSLAYDEWEHRYGTVK